MKVPFTTTRPQGLMGVPTVPSTAFGVFLSQLLHLSSFRNISHPQPVYQRKTLEMHSLTLTAGGFYTFGAVKELDGVSAVTPVKRVVLHGFRV